MAGGATLKAIIENTAADVTLAVGGSSPLLVATGNGSNQVFITNTAAVTVLTGSGNDTIYAGTGADVIRANGGNDVLIDQASGSNTLDGGDGADALYGFGWDTLFGSAGNALWRPVV